MHDPLTGLPNRSLLADRLSQALARADRNAQPVAVLFCDLDRFKKVNDASGHLAGDQVLVEVARRLQGTVRPADTVARFGGDEFVMVCEYADSVEACRIAGRMASSLAEPIFADGQRLYVSASIGIAVTPPLDGSAESMLRCADAAMYDAKTQGRARFRVFDTTLTDQAAERQQLTNDLREAFTTDALSLRFQPVVDLSSSALVGVESLVRWNHPTRGWVSPELFVPLAEDSGLIWALDRWVLDRACRDGVAMRASGALPAHARLAVNISSRNVTNPELVAALQHSASTAGLPLNVLDVEVTETGIMADAPAACVVLQALRALDVGVTLDDFGTGYSSLSHLRDLPVTAIKIDRRFVQDLTVRPDDRAIVAAVVQLAQAVGLRTIAEGVETPNQLSMLRQMGCLAGQGYLWSRPLDVNGLTALFAHGESHLTPH
jgi:diguanylate cyclase (GGDEF)-like protein